MSQSGGALSDSNLDTESKSITLEKVSDIYAFRIITSSKENCYKVLGKIHMHWPMVPERFKDFISTPKPNGYS